MFIDSTSPRPELWRRTWVTWVARNTTNAVVMHNIYIVNSHGPTRTRTHTAQQIDCKSGKALLSTYNNNECP